MTSETTIQAIFSEYYADFEPKKLTSYQKDYIQKRYIGKKIMLCGIVWDVSTHHIALEHTIDFKVLSADLKYYLNRKVTLYVNCSFNSIDKQFVFSIQHGDCLDVQSTIEQFSVEGKGQSEVEMNIFVEAIQVKKIAEPWLELRHWGLAHLYEFYKKEKDIRDKEEVESDRKQQEEQKRRNERLRREKNISDFFILVVCIIMLLMLILNISKCLD
jgi:hypothetical protein